MNFVALIYRDVHVRGGLLRDASGNVFFASASRFWYVELVCTDRYYSNDDISSAYLDCEVVDVFE